jgi:hypothetical protein
MVPQTPSKPAIIKLASQQQTEPDLPFLLLAIRLHLIDRDDETLAMRPPPVLPLGGQCLCW